MEVFVSMRTILVQEKLATQEIHVVTQDGLVNTLRGMDTIHARIKARRLELNLSLEQVGDRIGVAWQTVQQWERPDGTAPKRARLEAVARALDTTPEYLSFGATARASLPPPPPLIASEPVATYTPTEDEFSLVPQLDLEASCGNGRFEDHVVVKGGLAFKRSSLRDFGVQEENARIIYASGQSMEPTIGHGRVVLIDTAQNSPVDGKVFLICDPDGAMYLKRLVRDYRPDTGGMAWIMRSDNPNKQEYPDKLLPQDDRTSIVGRAVWNDNML